MTLRFVDRFDSPVTLVGLRESGWMRQVNANLRQRSEGFEHGEPLAFFCECRNTACFSSIWMTATEFDATEAARTGWLLNEGHEPSMPWSGSALDDQGLSGTVVLSQSVWAQKGIGGDEAA